MVIDHVIYAHPDLDAAVAYLANRFGVLATGGGRHPARGTHNKLLALGPRTYLEVIALDPDQPEPDEPRPYGVEGINRGGLVGWALAVDDIDAAVANARATGVDPARRWCRPTPLRPGSIETGIGKQGRHAAPAPLTTNG